MVSLSVRHDGMSLSQERDGVSLSEVKHFLRLDIFSFSNEGEEEDEDDEEEDEDGGVWQGGLYSPTPSSWSPSSGFLWSLSDQM